MHGNANHHLTVRRPNGETFTNTPAYLNHITTQRQTDDTATKTRAHALKDRHQPA